MTLVSQLNGLSTAAQAKADTSRGSIQGYANVLYALVMHDIKNRFFGSGVGQIVMVIWPFVHILVIVIIHVIGKRVNPFGESILQYSAVSVFPFICFNYIFRWIAFSAVTNRSFLQYPIVKPLDILYARAVLETLGAVLVAVLLMIVVSVAGYDVMPADPLQAAYAVGATVFLAWGMGVLNGVICFIIPMWTLIVMLLVILTYITSGILFVASYMPEQFRVPLGYNPLLHCTEWMRSAYYPDYPTLVLDKAYLLEFGLVSLTLGLILERLMRRFF